jgi:hypothetical protein
MSSVLRLGGTSLGQTYTADTRVKSVAQKPCDQV